MSNKTWVKFKKGHPDYAYFPGDVTQLPDEVLEGKKGLHELGYTVPATKAEIAEAKELDAVPVSKGVKTLQDIIAEQQAELSALKAMLGTPPAPTTPPAV